MSLKVAAQHQEVRPHSPVFDDFEDDTSASPKIDQAQVKNKVLEILRKPCAVNAKELVQRATFGRVDPFDAFDSTEFLSKIKK
jgi:hypothetical protein